MKWMLAVIFIDGSAGGWQFEKLAHCHAAKHRIELDVRIKHVSCTRNANSKVEGLLLYHGVLKK